MALFVDPEAESRGKRIEPIMLLRHGPTHDFAGPGGDPRLIADIGDPLFVLLSDVISFVRPRCASFGQELINIYVGPSQRAIETAAYLTWELHVGLKEKCWVESRGRSDLEGLYRGAPPANDRDYSELLKEAAEILRTGGDKLACLDPTAIEAFENAKKIRGSW